MRVVNNMRLADLEDFEQITIQCHDNPDADTIGSGFALYKYFESIGKKVRFIYSGTNRINKSNLKLMVEYLDIPLEYCKASDIEIIEGLLLLVDCQYGAGNVTKLPAENVLVIDHHPLEIKDLKNYRIQQNLGSCATLVWMMLKEEGFPVDVDETVGTALYYGLYTDTNQFAELFNPMDLDMRESLAVNKRMITKFRNSNLSLKELEIAGIAMLRYNYNDEYHFAVIKAQPCDPNILGLISDFLLQVGEIDTCVVYNEQVDGYKLSVRSCIKEVNANELAEFLTEGIGSGGGHYEKAGGFISMKFYEEKYPTLHSEAYFNNRMTEYFDLFTVATTQDYQVDLNGMLEYRRINEPLCYVRLTDIVPMNSQVVLRTRVGDREMLLSEDTYLVMESDGMIRLYSKERFHKYFRTTENTMEDSYYVKTEYVPTIKDCVSGHTYLLSDYDMICYPNEELRVYAKPLVKGMKLFTEWDEEQYMLGMPGAYVVVASDDLHDITIESSENFKEKFQQTLSF